MKLGSLLSVWGVCVGLFSNLCPAALPPWTNTSAPYEDWGALASSADGSVLVAATGGGFQAGSIYVSTNSGGTWMLTGAPQVVWTAVAASADGHQLVASAGGSFSTGRIYLSTDLGTTWTICAAPGAYWSGVASSADGARLVAVAGGNCASGPIFTTTNSGGTWIQTAAPIESWWSVASSADGTKLAASTVGDGIYLSADSGTTWTRTMPPVGWWWTVTLSADGGTLVAVASGGPIYVSSNWGTTWNLTYMPNGSGMTSVASCVDGTKLVAVVQFIDSWNSLILTSLDSGATWITNQVADCYQPGGGNACVASSMDGTRLTAAFGSGLIYTWQAPLPAVPQAATLASFGTNGDVTLSGSVNPNAAETWAWFEWDACPGFGLGTAPVAVGSGWIDLLFQAAMSEWPPGVARYSRIVAANDFGLSIGRPVIYQEPRITLLGDNPLYLVCSDTYAEPGSTVKAQPVAVAAGLGYSLALKANRMVVGWGNAPAVPLGLYDVVCIAAGRSHGLALMNDGTVAAWGDNTHGEMNVPENLGIAVAVAAGYGFSLALKSDGTVVGWGLGATNPPVPDGLNFGQAMVPAGLSNVVAVAAGFDSSLALKLDGTVVGWGNTAYGGASPPAGLSNVVAIAAGAALGVALKSDGTMAAWGLNASNQTDVPAGLSNVVAIAAGLYHCLALQDDGTVVGWGDNQFGQASPPAGLSNVVAIAAGTHHSLALGADGTVVGWGLNSDGEAETRTNLAIALGSANVSGGVYAGVPGTYTRTYTAAEAPGATGTATRTVLVLAAREAQQHVLDQILALPPGPTRQLQSLDLAAASLNRALTPNLWTDDMHLAGSSGAKVFAEDAGVILELSLLLRQKNNPVSKIQGWMEDLARSDRLLALNACVFFGGHFYLPPHVAEWVGKGDQAAAGHRYGAANFYYAEAWQCANRYFHQPQKTGHP